LYASFKAENPERFSHTLWHGEVHVPPVRIQPAPRVRAADKIVSRTYTIVRRKKVEQVKALAMWFESEEDVQFMPGTNADEIEVLAHESRHGYIVEVISYLENGIVPPS
jgi:hypothetical protein